MNNLQERYKDKIEFLLVYIREAHPTDGWQAPSNEREGILLAQPKTSEERQEAASLCVRKLDIHFPALLDGMDNSTEAAYTAFPDRMYLVDRDGRIAFKGPPGPAGFQPPRLEDAIKKLLGE